MSRRWFEAPNRIPEVPSNGFAGLANGFAAIPGFAYGPGKREPKKSFKTWWQRVWRKKYGRYRDDQCDEFTIRVRMKKRWTPHFLAMLKTMQQYGSWGCSRMLSFYADGDGDFRPKFEWPKNLNSDGKPVKDDRGNRTWDAG